jgi:DNA sulfur modification protein DndD
MILKKLTLDNFRQYLGRHEIVFASGKQKNVTLIHGENGFGKTCFLNSLLWGFYGHDGLTADLPKPDQILPDTVRETSKRPDQDSARVSIVFDHGGESYTLTRSITLAQERASKGEDSNLELSILKVDGQTINPAPREAQRIIDSMLPPELRELLFFNGERIDHLAMEQNAGEIRDAVRRMLGLKLLDDTIADLKSQNVRGKFAQELRNNTDEETARLLDDEQKKTAELETKRDSMETCKKNQRAVEEEIVEIDRRLEANREARELQQRRSALEAEQTEKQKTLQELEKQLAELIATDGYTLFCTGLIQEGKEITHTLRTEGRIPARVMNDFIHDLLKAGKCICGCALPEGSEAWKSVEAQLTKAGDPEFNNAVRDLDRAIGVIESTVTRTQEALRRLVQDRDYLVERLRVIREDLEEIREKLGSKDDQEVHKLESDREAKQLRLIELAREEERLRIAVEDLVNNLRQIQDALHVKQQKGVEAARAKRRLERVDSVVDLLRRLLEVESEDLGKELGKEIERVFSRVTLQDYRLQLTQDFSLRLLKTIRTESGMVSVEVAHGQGHRQVMSLVFISSLVALAQRRNEIPSIMKDLQGGDYPLVMDSPFGQLGEEFRGAIAKNVPQLAPQAIVLVSSSQYRGEVERELGSSNRIGRRYILRYHAPSKRDDAAGSLTLNGATFDIYQKDETEHTEVVEV